MAPQAQATAGNLHLGRDGVQAVNDIVIAGHVNLIGILGQVELLVGRHLACWIDVVHALGGNIHLGTADGAVQGKNLAVDVGHAHGVIIHQVKRAHTTARQRLDHIASHTADAEHRHTALRQALHRSRPQHQLGACKR